MDFKNSVKYRYDNLEYYAITGDNKYDYAKEGVLRRCLPSILFKGNSILVTFIQLIDLRIIMLLKYIDRLKHFKHLTYL